LYGKSVPEILLYGSYARGQAHGDSDIDILLIYPKAIYPGVEIQRVSSLLADLNLRYGVLISILPRLKASIEIRPRCFGGTCGGRGFPLKPFEPHLELNPKFHHVLFAAFNKRQLGDYRVQSEFGREDIETLLVQVTEFVNAG
jgi:predicted nucleotidyltransferase